MNAYPLACGVGNGFKRVDVMKSCVVRRVCFSCWLCWVVSLATNGGWAWGQPADAPQVAPLSSASADAASLSATPHAESSAEGLLSTSRGASEQGLSEWGLSEWGRGPLGGGAGADFTPLMTLIQQTIDPDAWIDNSSVMTPFPSGVFIDAAGKLQQLAPARGLAAGFADASAASGPWLRHAWREASPLRVVSLRQLDIELGRLATQGWSQTQDLAQLAGLKRIEYVRVDPDQAEIWLAGPAAGVDAPVGGGFHLADLALLVNLITRQSPPLGCSIDPTDAGIIAAQQMLTRPGAKSRLAAQPAKFAEQLQQAMGAHEVSVFGMPSGSPAAVALVAADEHMKRIGFGTERTLVPMQSYFDHLDRLADVPEQSLIRWWFAYASQPVRTETVRVELARDDNLPRFVEQHVFQFPEQCVVLLSEQQWVSQQGRQATGKIDPAAEAFAASMTQGLSELRQVHAAYARMCAVFETALALRLAIEASGQDNLHAWLPNLKQVGLENFGPRPEPKTVSGLTAWHKLKQGITVAAVSGGVQIAPQPLSDPANWQAVMERVDFPLINSSVDRSRSSWWWD